MHMFCQTDLPQTFSWLHLMLSCYLCPTQFENNIIKYGIICCKYTGHDHCCQYTGHDHHCQYTGHDHSCQYTGHDQMLDRLPMLQLGFELSFAQSQLHNPHQVRHSTFMELCHHAKQSCMVFTHRCSLLRGRIPSWTCKSI